MNTKSERKTLIRYFAAHINGRIYLHKNKNHVNWFVYTDYFDERYNGGVPPIKLFNVLKLRPMTIINIWRYKKARRRSNDKIWFR
jgi:hypothetical protein